jgi:uncharacterized protein (DUF2141 family)
MKIAMCICFLALSNVCLSAQTLTVKVENIEQVKGNLRVGVYNNEKDFTEVYFRGQDVKITGKTMTVTFTDLPKGAYAVSAYQDMNGNKQLDKNFWGIPKEKYGFSNNADKPDYKKCIFQFHSDMTINIKLQ